MKMNEQCTVHAQRPAVAQVLVLALLVVAVDAGAGKVGLRAAGRSVGLHLATDVKLAKKDMDLETRRQTDNLLRLLARDEKESEDKMLNKKKSTTVKETTKQKEKDDVLEFDEFLPGCLIHTARMVQTLDRSYTDQQLKTVLENECRLDKEFPLVYEDGYDTHEACMCFAEKLVLARNVELDSGSTRDYKTFCEEYFDHKLGKFNGCGEKNPPVVTTTKPPVFSWVYWRVWVLLFLVLLACFFMACIFMMERSTDPPVGNRNAPTVVERSEAPPTVGRWEEQVVKVVRTERVWVHD